jgi:hypothetical protein
VLVHGDAEVALVRERETLATVTELERLPPHLAVDDASRVGSGRSTPE